VIRVKNVRQRLQDGECVEVDGADYLARTVAGEPVLHQRLCPHRGSPMAEAYVVGQHLVCSWHRSVFCGSDGARMFGPATCGIRVLAARFDGDDVVAEEPGPGRPEPAADA
jgi:nitrite reductase/ring-hydroxylating ferredoxin subunit